METITSGSYPNLGCMTLLSCCLWLYALKTSIFDALLSMQQ